MGLGLAIARRAVAVHAGVIRAFNTEPGLAVEIDLPQQAHDGTSLRVEGRNSARP